jgi:hopene-associated glycosyltransferase HpnB
MVRLRCTALAERALVPAFVFFFAMLYPFAWVNDPRRRTAAAAGGCMLVRYRALVRIGGMARIASALIDDCTLAAAIKEGGSIRLDLAPESYSLRPYEHWSDIWMMIARSAFTQLRHSVWLLAGCVLGMLLTYAAPPLLTLAYPQTAWPAAIAWLLMTVAYLPILRYYRVNVLYALALPLIAAFYLGATLDSARRYWTGQGGQWKGRLQARAIKDEPQDR